MSRTALRRLVGVVLAVVGVLALPSTVSAHAVLESSTPSANSVVESSPPQIVLDYDEDVEAALSSIQLFDADRQRIELGAPGTGDDNSIVVATIPSLDDGL